MKQFVGLLSLIIALALVAGPAVAATHHMTGDVRTINQDTKTFTLAEHRMLRGEKEQTFHVRDSALLSSLQSGERVRVTYEKQGQQLIASDIQPAAAAKTK